MTVLESRWGTHQSVRAMLHRNLVRCSAQIGIGRMGLSISNLLNPRVGSVRLVDLGDSTNLDNQGASRSDRTIWVL